MALWDYTPPAYPQEYRYRFAVVMIPALGTLGVRIELSPQQLGARVGAMLLTDAAD